MEVQQSEMFQSDRSQFKERMEEIGNTKNLDEWKERFDKKFEKYIPVNTFRRKTFWLESETAIGI